MGSRFYIPEHRALRRRLEKRRWDRMRSHRFRPPFRLELNGLETLLLTVGLAVSAAVSVGVLGILIAA